MNEKMTTILKMSDLIGIYFLLPIILIISEIIWRKRNNKEINKKQIYVRWIYFCTMALSALETGITQSFFPQFTATMLQIPSESYIVIRELGFASIGTGVISALALKYPKWRIPSVITRGVFISLALILHFTRLNEINLSELLAITIDIIIVMVAVLIILYDRKYLKE